MKTKKRKHGIIETCQALAKSHSWDLPYTINADETVTFSIGGATFTGKIVGDEFHYSGHLGGGNGIINL